MWTGSTEGSGLCPYTFTQFILFLFLIVLNTKPIIAILLVQGTAQWLMSKDAVAKPETSVQYPVGRKRLMHLVLWPQTPHHDTTKHTCAFHPYIYTQIHKTNKQRFKRYCLSILSYIYIYAVLLSPITAPLRTEQLLSFCLVDFVVSCGGSNPVPRSWSRKCSTT